MSEINLFELSQYINHYLSILGISDYCPNGLQVEGKKQIQKS